MIDFQFGYMYGRYFMWNFTGRQNDIQGNLDLHNGNWLSGINFIDAIRLGPQTNLSDDIANNKGRNTYFFFPLILGIIGLLFHLKNDKENFYTLLLFFLFTGLAIIFYTNPKPFEPRERDYAVVGSFYVFAIWIGFGVMAIFKTIKEFAPKKMAAIGVTVVTLIAVPVLMAAQNWDDHDRSNRYTSHLNAKAYLDSCAKNAIMFTIGDNDTFPLWYMQEVENYRTDIKLINTSLFATAWYIDQMKRKTYKADPIPSQLTHNEYKYGTMDVAYHYELPQFKDSIITIDYFMRWIQSKNDVTYIETQNDKKEKTYPTNKIRIPVDKEAVLASGLVKSKDADLIVPYIDIEIDKGGITKNRILMLDILANNNWKHPMYFTGGASADDEYIWLKDYLQADGLVFKFVPIKTPLNGASLFDMGRLDTEMNYNYWKNVDWKNINDGKIYIDVETRKNAVSLRNNMMRLVDVLMREGDTIKAEEILDLSLEKLPIDGFLHYGMTLGMPDAYYRMGKIEKARKLNDQLAEKFTQNLRYYSTFDEQLINVVFDEIETNLLMYNQLIQTALVFDTEEYATSAREKYKEHLDLFNNFLSE
jgi:tetratricopeptide (TPR) repeat protein